MSVPARNLSDKSLIASMYALSCSISSNFAACGSTFASSSATIAWSSGSGEMTVADIKSVMTRRDAAASLASAAELECIAVVPKSVANFRKAWTRGCRQDALVTLCHALNDSPMAATSSRVAVPAPNFCWNVSRRVVYSPSLTTAVRNSSVMPSQGGLDSASPTCCRGRAGWLDGAATMASLRRSRSVASTVFVGNPTSPSPRMSDATAQTSSTDCVTRRMRSAPYLSWIWALPLWNAACKRLAISRRRSNFAGGRPSCGRG